MKQSFQQNDFILFKPLYLVSPFSSEKGCNRVGISISLLYNNKRQKTTQKSRFIHSDVNTQIEPLIVR